MIAIYVCGKRKRDEQKERGEDRGERSMDTTTFSADTVDRQQIGVLDAAKGRH